MAHLLLIAASSFLVFHLLSAQDFPQIVNLNDRCFWCLCIAATKCNLTLGCDEGYCGPYKISRIYWKDAGEVILPDDERQRPGAYEDCALSYQCAQKMIINYLVKYGRDCNDDGVTNCDDFAMINFNGGFQCKANLNRNEAGRAWVQRFRSCHPETRL